MSLQKAVEEFQKQCLQRDPSCQFRIAREICIDVENGGQYRDYTITIYHSKGVDKYAVWENNHGVAGGAIYV